MLRDKVDGTCDRLVSCTKRAKIFQSKLQEETGIYTTYQNSLRNMKKWLDKAKKILTNDRANISDRMRAHNVSFSYAYICTKNSALRFQRLRFSFTLSDLNFLILLYRTFSAPPNALLWKNLLKQVAIFAIFKVKMNVEMLLKWKSELKSSMKLLSKMLLLI